MTFPMVCSYGMFLWYVPLICLSLLFIIRFTFKTVVNKTVVDKIVVNKTVVDKIVVNKTVDQKLT
jgi:hypothetical protein